MKSPCIFTLSVLLAAVLLPESSAEQKNAWSLDRAIAAARENSPDARIAMYRVRSAEAVAQHARAPGKPQVYLSGKYSYTNNPMYAFGSILNQRAFDSSIDFNNPGNIDNLNATGSIAYTVYDGGRRSAGVKGADAGLLAAEHDEQSAKLRLQTEVARSYLNIRKAREAVQAVEANVRAMEAAVESARARFDEGQMLKADLLSLEVQLAQAREDFLTAKNGAELADRVFIFAVGLDESAVPINIVENDRTVEQITFPVDLDFSSRPEILASTERIRAAQAGVDAARGGRNPTVNVFGSYQYDHGWKLGEGDDSWFAGVSVDMNVFDGGAVSSQIRRREAELAQAVEALRKMTLGIQLEVEQARLTHAQAKERLAVTEAAVAQAEESAALSRARFEKGALTTADLIGVEGRLTEARMRRAVAVADERIALADLRLAVGQAPLN